MIAAEESIHVAASPARVLDFVADLHRYRLADHKIGRVLDAGQGDDTIVRFRARLRGLPGPVVAQRVRRLRADNRILIESVPSWQDAIVRFRGWVTATPEGGGTAVRHREEFHPHPALKPLFDRVYGPWLQRDLKAELRRLAELVEGSGGVDQAAHPPAY
jgi:Polyketide cyclase / dehydrase and lipid transport